MTSSRRPPRLLLRFEGLHVGTQIAIVGPIALGLLWAAHVGLMNQPVLRGLGYALFWGVLATGIVVAAVRTEHARRTHAARLADERGAQGASSLHSDDTSDAQGR